MKALYDSDHLHAWYIAARRLTGAILLAAGSLRAQNAEPGGAGLTAERLTHSRWLHGRQQPRFTVFRDARRWVHVDSVVPHDGRRARTFHLRLEDRTVYDARATLRVGSTGAWLDASAAFTEPVQSDSSPLDAARHMRSQLQDEAQNLSILETRLWGFVPVVPPGRLARGLRWTDTLDLAAEQDGFRQVLRGVRLSVVLRDTVVAGRRLWVISDSARVRYEERSMDEERTLDAVVTIDRAADGIMRGRHVYDEALGLSLVRHDTTVLAGEAVLRYPDGRSFRTPARYEASGSWTMRDSASHQRRVDEIRREWESELTGMVILPVNDRQRAVQRGAPGVRDSLIAVWERTQDPNEYDNLYAVLASWGSDSLKRFVTDRRVAAGDTALLLDILEKQGMGYGRQLDTAEARVLLPLLENPGAIFAFGLDRDPFYESIVYGVTYHPPAGTPDASEWPCTPDACRMLADQWHRSSEPRLREIGLAVLATTNPAHWLDTLLARAKPASQLLGSVRGIAAIEWPAPAADWREWRRWVVTDNCFQPSNCRASVSFSAERAQQLRFHQARGTRDLAGEITGRFAAEASDSARLVFGVLRLAFEGDALSPDSVVAHFRSSSAPIRALAQGELEYLFEEPLVPPDSATATEILDQFIAARYTSSPGWQSLSALTAGRAPVLGPDRQALEPGAFLLEDVLPPTLRRKWEGRAPLISSEAWDARSEREQRSLTIVEIEGRVGPFVQIQVGTSARLPRRQDESPHGYASSYTLFLMRLGGTWVVVGSGRSWIT